MVTSVGTRIGSLGISSRQRQGTHFKASGGSGVSCFSRNSCVARASSARSSSVMLSLTFCKISFSAASSREAFSGSGCQRKGTMETNKTKFNDKVNEILREKIKHTLPASQ